ncbi:RHS repeat domain-containing protein [Pantoea sp. B65]|uniref:RHS repeat domain-containing protein n=1 Tax=Pantoea sp. B65 TaxID=2813359 RepID=UPI0039B52397
MRLLHWQSGLPAGISNNSLRYSYDNLTGSSGLEVDAQGELISQEEYYPYGGTAIRTARSQAEAEYKTRRYNGKERDASGLYYYGYRYYQCWAGRWLSADPAGTIDGLNLYQMVNNNPIRNRDPDGLCGDELPAASGSHSRSHSRRDILLKKANDYSSEILAENLTQISQNQPAEGVMVDTALISARDTLVDAIFMAKNDPATTKMILEPYMGELGASEADVARYASIIKIWTETHNVIENMLVPEIKNQNFAKFSNSQQYPSVTAMADPETHQIVLFENFFTSTVEERRIIFMHEHSHLKGPELWDYWYLGTDNPEDVAARILAHGLTREPPQFLPVYIRDKIRELTGLNYLTAEQCIQIFNDHPDLRKIIAAMNPDNLFFAANAVAQFRIK